MKERLANYKVPTVTKIVDVLKRNQMGKSNYPDFFLEMEWLANRYGW